MSRRIRMKSDLLLLLLGSLLCASPSCDLKCYRTSDRTGILSRPFALLHATNYRPALRSARRWTKASLIRASHRLFCVFAFSCGHGGPANCEMRWPMLLLEPLQVNSFAIKFLSSSIPRLPGECAHSRAFPEPEHLRIIIGSRRCVPLPIRNSRLTVALW